MQPPATGLPNSRIRPHALNNQTSYLPSLQIAMHRQMWVHRILSIPFDKFLILCAQYPQDQHDVYGYSTMLMQAHPHQQPPPQGQRLPHHPSLLGILPQIFNLLQQHFHIPDPCLRPNSTPTSLSPVSLPQWIATIPQRIP